MIDLSIPDFGHLQLQSLVLDYNGTCALDGTVLPGVKERLERLSGELDLFVVTADTFGTVHEAMASMPIHVRVLENGVNEAIAKQQVIRSLDEHRTVAVGNGRNDCLMLETAALGIGVIQAEGMAGALFRHAEIVVTDIRHALALLLYPRRLLATLRS